MHLYVLYVIEILTNRRSEVSDERPNQALDRGRSPAEIQTVCKQMRGGERESEKNEKIVSLIITINKMQIQKIKFTATVPMDGSQTTFPYFNSPSCFLQPFSPLLHHLNPRMRSHPIFFLKAIQPV